MVKLNKSDFTIFKKLAELVTFKNVLNFIYFKNDVFKILLKDWGGGDSYSNLPLLVENDFLRGVC